MRKGRKILTYGKLGVPKIQRYSILSLEYKPKDGDKINSRSEGQRAGIRHAVAHQPAIFPTIQEEHSSLSL